MTRFNTAICESIYWDARETLRQFLRDLDENPSDPSLGQLATIRQSVADAKAGNADAPDCLFDDLFVLDCYTDFLESYADLWAKILQRQYSSSWTSLQDAFDSLRLVRRFSSLDISLFEDQLVELEKAYPYNVFMSVGMTVEMFECSICGIDIDSITCKHRRGELYRGKMAVAIARNITNLDHVSLVDDPEDKRCVITHEDGSPAFDVVRYIAGLLKSRQMSISQFGTLAFSKRTLPNPEYRKLGRNAPCFCDSRKKFKLCCLGKIYVEQNHVDIIPRPFSADRAVA